MKPHVLAVAVVLSCGFVTAAWHPESCAEVGAAFMPNPDKDGTPQAMIQDGRGNYYTGKVGDPDIPNVFIKAIEEL